MDNGFDSFSEGGEHYFTYNLGGNVYLISEGYTSTGARDNGIQSVTNNMNNEARYQRQQDPKGHFFFNLRAGNNKEIATSRWFDDQGNMDSVIARMVAGLGLGGRGWHCHPCSPQQCHQPVGLLGMVVSSPAGLRLCRAVAKSLVPQSVGVWSGEGV